MNHNNFNSKKYIKICKDSGCVSANYHITEDNDDHITLITKDNIEISGKFIALKNRNTK